MNERTKALAIPPEVKERVAERDSFDDWPCCLWCGKPAPMDDPLAYSNAHYIARSQGGLGIEKNILTLCPECHRLYDQTTKREEMRNLFRLYLRDQYPKWSEDELIFKK